MGDCRLPNLYIVGAPKCGTSALSHYLAGHPDIFMSEQSGVKEPGFYSRDREIPFRPVNSESEYKALFAPAPPGVPYIGEASTSYLESESAIPNILADCPDARLIVMLRNPVDIVVALHNQRFKRGWEPYGLRKAWDLQVERSCGRRIPDWLGVGRGDIFQYGRIATLGEQMARLFGYISRDRVHVIVYDDLKKTPAAVYESVLRWLHLQGDGRSEFPVVNPRVKYRLPALESTLQFLRRKREMLGLPGGIGVHAAINRLNRRRGTGAIDKTLARELRDYFRQDIRLLSGVIGRDLDCWLA